MDLKDFLSEYPNLEILNSSQQNEELISFMDKSPMRLGGIELLYDRRPLFNRLLQCQGGKFFTLIGRSTKHQVMGLFSLSVTKKIIHGEKINCAYIGDFRTDGSRQAAHLWRKEYARLIEIIKKDKSINCPQYFLTAVLKKNVEALRSLASNKPRYGFYYHLLTEMNMINVFGQFFWQSSSPLKVTVAKAEDLAELKNFLNEKEKLKNFGSIMDDSEDDVWTYREKNWEQFHINQFLIIKNDQGKIKACTLPWDPAFAKRMKVVKAPSWMRWIFKVLGLFGLKIPAVGSYLQTIYLTHLNWDESLNFVQVISAFIQAANEKFPTAHMISFADDKDMAKDLSGFILQKVPVQLFEVSTEPYSKLDPIKKISFEMGLV